MQQSSMDILLWTQKYSTERASVDELAKLRYPNGFVCPVANMIRPTFSNVTICANVFSASTKRR